MTKNPVDTPSNPVPSHGVAEEVEALIKRHRKRLANPDNYPVLAQSEHRALIDIITATTAKITSETEAREKAERRAYDFDLLYQATHLDLVAAEAKVADLTRKLEAAAVALEPFKDFAQWVDAEGWTSNIHREGISVWFGPSDFRRAREAHAALLGKEKS